MKYPTSLDLVRIATAAAAMLVVASLLGCKQAPLPQSALVPPDSAIDGLGMEELGCRWWTWYSTTEPSDDHLSSADARCHTQDPSLSVTMLAGNSSSDPAYRVCSVSPGQHLFFPILTVMSTFRPATEAACEAQARGVRELNDVVPEMTVKVDGHLVSDMASRRGHGSKCKTEASLALATPGAGPARAGMVFDGYWVALKPLAPGEHVIEFYAKYNSNKHRFGHISQDVKYVITVR